MFGIPLPWLLLGLTLALFGTYRGGYHYGWTDRDKEMQIEIAKKNEEAREIERNMTEKLNTTATKLQETTDVVNKKQTDLNRLIAAGRVRLPTPSCVQTPTAATPAAANSPETRSEPNRQANEASDAERATLAAIAEIVAQGDRNTAQLNACIDAYNEARNLLNGKP